jgi:hypothetical protein
MLSGETVITAAARQVSCDLADEAVVLSLERDVYYGLNPVAARVWSLLRQPRTVSEVRDVLLSEYDVERDRCEQDLLMLLDDLAAKNLITVDNGTPT